MKNNPISKRFAKQLAVFCSKHNYIYIRTAETNISCGIYQIYNLNDQHSAADQLSCLIYAFDIPEQLDDEYRTGKAQIIFSDTVNSERRVWAAAKSVSYHGPVNVNPNSDNAIKLYIFTPECFRPLIRHLPVAIQRKYFPK